MTCGAGTGEDHAQARDRSIRHQGDDAAAGDDLHPLPGLQARALADLLRDHDLVLRRDDGAGHGRLPVDAVNLRGSYRHAKRLTWPA